MVKDIHSDSSFLWKPANIMAQWSVVSQGGCHILARATCGSETLQMPHGTMWSVSTLISPPGLDCCLLGWSGLSTKCKVSGREAQPTLPPQEGKGSLWPWTRVHFSWGCLAERERPPPCLGSFYCRGRVPVTARHWGHSTEQHALLVLAPEGGSHFHPTSLFGAVHLLHWVFHPLGHRKSRWAYFFNFS